jgi:hypothetical protein
MSPNNKKDRHIRFLWFACAIEALITSIYILFLPTDSKNAFLLGFSKTRLIIVGCLLAAFLLTLFFAYINSRKIESNRFLILVAHLEYKEGWLFILLVSIFIGFSSFLLFTPPSFRGARIERLAPVLIWMILCCIQIGFFLLYYKKEKISATWSVLQKNLEKASKDQRVGYLLLFISLLIGLVTIFYTYYNFGDESDTYTVGWLLTKGYVLYKDLFSHHFPFSYLWVWLISLFSGPSIPIYRLSLLLLRIGLLTIVMSIYKKPIIIGLTSIGLSLIGPIFLGNMLLYYSFDAIFMVSSVFIILAILNKDIDFSIKLVILIGIMISLSVFNDPLMAFPATVITIFLAISGYQKGEIKKQKLLYATSTFFIITTIFTFFASIIFSITSFPGFIQDAILFNKDIYANYSGQVVTISAIFSSFRNSFNIFDPSIRTYVSPTFHWDHFRQLNSWVFTALFFRISILFTSIILFLKRKYFSGIFLLLIGGFTYYQGSDFFHGLTYYFIAIACAAYTSVECCNLVSKRLRSIFIKPLKSQINTLVTLILSITITVMFAILSVRLVEYWITHRSELSYTSQFTYYVNDSGYVKQFACGYEGASLLAIPFYPWMYYYSGLPPVSPYFFLLPWVAEIGEDQVISELSVKPTIVYIVKDADVWSYKVTDYLADLISYLDNNYVQVDKNVYISPFLNEYCNQ